MSEIKEGSLHILTSYDFAFEIRLPQIPVLFGSHQRDASGYPFLRTTIGRETQPLRIAMDSMNFRILGAEKMFEVYCTFFDVGAISLEFIAPLSHKIDELPKLAAHLQNSKELMAASRKLAESIFEKAKPGLVNPNFNPSPSVFAIFNLAKMERVLTYQEIVEELGTILAKTLRLSDEPIGQSEIHRTLNPFVTYSDNDVVFSSANVAIIFDETSSDVIDIFELLNVQSLELRLIDARLDRALQGLYDSSEQSTRFLDRLPPLFDKESRRLNTLHLDSTIIAERVELSFKFAFDSYLIRIHELLVQKMFLTSYSRTIDRKLQAIRDILTDRRDRAASQRAEFLEWIIIALIAFEIVKSFI